MLWLHIGYVIALCSSCGPGPTIIVTVQSSQCVNIKPYHVADMKWEQTQVQPKAVFLALQTIVT